MTTREIVSGTAVVVVALVLVGACAVANDTLAPMLAVAAALIPIAWVLRSPTPIR